MRVLFFEGFCNDKGVDNIGRYRAVFRYRDVFNHKVVFNGRLNERKEAAT